MSACGTHVGHVREQLAEGFVLEVKGEALRGQLTFLRATKVDVRGWDNTGGLRSTSLPIKRAHGQVGRLYAAQSGTFFHHEAQEASEDGGHRPRRVPRVRVKIGDGETQPGRERETAGMTTDGWRV